MPRHYIGIHCNVWYRVGQQVVPLTQKLNLHQTLKCQDTLHIYGFVEIKSVYNTVQTIFTETGILLDCKRGVWFGFNIKFAVL